MSNHSRVHGNAPIEAIGPGHSSSLRRATLFLVVGLISASCAAAVPLTAKFTMPNTDRGSACGFTPNPGPIFAPGGLRAVIVWNGPVTDSLRIGGLDSSQVVNVTLIDNAPPGIYQKQVWVEKIVNGRLYVSCGSAVHRDTISSITREVTWE